MLAAKLDAKDSTSSDPLPYGCRKLIEIPTLLSGEFNGFGGASITVFHDCPLEHGVAAIATFDIASAGGLPAMQSPLVVSRYAVWAPHPQPFSPKGEKGVNGELSHAMG
jgi:hypothetical protein